MALLKAFVDDSGSDHTSEWFVLAGYISTLERWDTFDDKWQRVLNEHPRLDCFKASQAESLRPDGQWSGVSKLERDTRIDRFIRVIGETAKQSYSIRLKRKIYEDTIGNDAPKDWRSPYYWLLLGFIKSLESIDRHMGWIESVSVLIQIKRIKLALANFTDLADTMKYKGRVVGLHFEDDRKFLPLQAADLLAWQVRRKICFSAEEEWPDMLHQFRHLTLR